MRRRSIGADLLLGEAAELGMPIKHEHIAAGRKLAVEVG
jgi:hypothetical protein